MRLEIPISQLRRGMYVLDLEKELGVPSTVYSIEGYILSQKEVDSLVERGYKTVYVDPGKSNMPKTATEGDVSEFEMIGSDKPRHIKNISVLKEYEFTEVLHTQYREIAKDICLHITRNQEFSISCLHEFADGLVDSIARNKCSLMLRKNVSRTDDVFIHGFNVGMLSVAMAMNLGVLSQYLPELAIAGILHDVGKLFVNPEILNFRGKLDDRQKKEMQDHVFKGWMYLEEHFSLSRMVLDAILDHHERYDGSGYPNRKEGISISFAGRILAVADVFDALTSKRSWRSPIAPSEAISKLYSIRQTFSPGLVESLIEIFGIYPPGTLVRLSNQQIGIVLESTADKPLKPRVVLVADVHGKKRQPKVIDLNKMNMFSISGTVSPSPKWLNIKSILDTLY